MDPRSEVRIEEGKREKRNRRSLQLLQRSPCRYRLLAPSGRPFTCKLLPFSRQPSLVTAKPALLVYVLPRPLPPAAAFERFRWRTMACRCASSMSGGSRNFSVRIIAVSSAALLRLYGG